jgi:hypothetical protein
MGCGCNKNKIKNTKSGRMPINLKNIKKEKTIKSSQKTNRSTKMKKTNRSTKMKIDNIIKKQKMRAYSKQGRNVVDMKKHKKTLEFWKKVVENEKLQKPNG